MQCFRETTIKDPSDLVFGRCPHPVRLTPEIQAGAGETLPEINFALPFGTEVSAATTAEVTALYAKMATDALNRAEALGCEKLVIEIELVFEQTLHPDWGRQVIEATRDVIESFRPRGVFAALRATVADIRDRNRPPRNRNSRETELMFESFEMCAPFADILAIESTGGKEVSDEAVLACDIGGLVFALGELGSRDMAYIWPRIVEIARRHQVVPGGDTACGFANTAMQLAGKKMIPTVIAAVVRAVGAARSLVAVECGATGPDKDCGYEGPMLKVIAGIPISMEGKSSACAHSSPIGNVAMATADLWSNESTPYTQLFGGYTPAVSLEELWYDCKLLNAAGASDQRTLLRDWLEQSDTPRSAEALVLATPACMRIAEAIVAHEDLHARAFAAAWEALAIIRTASDSGALRLPPRELPWLDRMQENLEEHHDLGAARWDHYAAMYPEKFLPEEYGLPAAG